MKPFIDSDDNRYWAFMTRARVMNYGIETHLHVVTADDPRKLIDGVQEDSKGSIFVNTIYTDRATGCAYNGAESFFTACKKKMTLGELNTAMENLAARFAKRARKNKSK